MKDNSIKCFDYIVNTRKTYDLLGGAVGLFLRRVKRYRNTESHEIKMISGRSLSSGSPLWSSWLRTTRKAISLAKEDYIKHFGEEDPKPEWLKQVSAVEVMEIALQHRDWWINKD